MSKGQTTWPGGRQLKMLRARSGLSQIEFAARCGLTQSTLSKLETGSRPPQAKTLRRIAQGLGMSLDSLSEELGSSTVTGSDPLPTLRTEAARLLVQLAIELDKALTTRR